MQTDKDWVKFTSQIVGGNLSSPLEDAWKTYYTQRKYDFEHKGFLMENFLKLQIEKVNLMIW